MSSAEHESKSAEGKSFAPGQAAAAEGSGDITLKRDSEIGGNSQPSSNAGSSSSRAPESQGAHIPFSCFGTSPFFVWILFLTCDSVIIAILLRVRFY